MATIIRFGGSPVSQEEYDALVSALTTADTQAANVLSGTKFVDKDGTVTNGAMADKTGTTGSVAVGGSYTIPKGYHDGTGTVSGPTLSGNAAVGDVIKSKTFYNTSGTKQTGTLEFTGDAAVTDVLTGKKFYSNDTTQKTGTMSNQGTKTYTIAPGGKQTIPKGYHSGSGYVQASAIGVSNMSNGNYGTNGDYAKTYTLTTTEAYTACLVIGVACHGIEGDGTMTLSISGGGTLTSMRTQYMNRGTYGTRISIYKGASIASGAKITMTDAVNMSGCGIYIVKLA